MANYKRLSFDNFLRNQLRSGKLTEEILSEIVDRKTLNRLLDNAENSIGAAPIDISQVIVTQGQLQEFPGSIPDLKGRIAMQRRELEEQNEDAANLKTHTLNLKPLP